MFVHIWWSIGKKQSENFPSRKSCKYFYYSLRKLLSPRLLSKMLKIRTYETTALSVVLNGVKRDLML